MNQNARPVHILSGFLGTGKTTLLNQLLKREDFANTLVIVNEFGEVPLDHHIIESSSETIVELSNGCLCCSIRGELVDTLISVSDRTFDRIIVETTGIADPLPIYQALMLQPVLAVGLRAGSILSVYDIVQGKSLIDQHEEAEKQIALADFIYISMRDKADDLAGGLKFAEKLNPNAIIFEASDDITAHTLDTSQHSPRKIPHSHHSGDYVSVVLETDQAQPYSAIIGFLHHLANTCGQSLLRAKGFAKVTELGNAPLLVQMSGHIVHDPVQLKSWPDGPQQTHIVVIAKDLDANIIRSVFNSFFDIVDIDTADRKALTDNPLAIPGM
ncbi:MAG: GTP-binding protein [Pseudomonadota bacterium]